MTAALRLLEVLRPVHDLQRAAAFYRDALGFADAPAQAQDASLRLLLAAAWGVAAGPLMRLRLGAQTLLLVACDQGPAPPDDGADDPRFQHIAIVARDMAAAWARLQPHAPAAITRGGPQLLPRTSGGVTAAKFRDPDGHPVELLSFADGQVPPRWQLDRAGPTLGIDHSAITVGNAERSIGFYAVQMGLHLRSRQTNRGPEQALLDGVDDPTVDVVALAPAEPSPHLELLGYRPARQATPASVARPRTATAWNVDALDSPDPRFLYDPDGHLHLLLPTPA